MAPTETALHADPADHSLLAPASSPAEPNGVLVLLGVGLVYAILIALLVLFESRPQPIVAPEAIPVEIIVEPPAPQEKPAAPEQQPQPPSPAKSLDEEPATDAPRAGADPQKQPPSPIEPPKAAAEPPPKLPSPSPEPGAAGGPKQEGDVHAKDAAAQPVDNRPAEVTRPAGETKTEKSEAPQKRAEAQAPPGYPQSFMDTQVAPAPDAGVAAYFERSPYSGNAKSTYLTTLFGMIRAHMPPDGAHVGEMEFLVGSSGNVIERRIVQPSGSRELDATALAAVAQAAPFPPPPYGGPLGMTYTYSGD
jgi:protein TonB